MLEKINLSLQNPISKELGSNGGPLEALIDESSIFGAATLRIKVIIGINSCYVRDCIDGDILSYSKPQLISGIGRVSGSRYVFELYGADNTSNIIIAVNS